MKRNAGTSSPQNYGPAAASHRLRDGGRKALLRLNRKIPYRLEHILFAGIVGFSIGISAMYSRLMKIETVDPVGVGDLRRGSTNTNKSKRRSSSNSNKSKDRRRVGVLEEDPPLEKNNNHNNPGRAWGSEKGKIKCDQEVWRIMSYWNDPRSNRDRAFVSPFLEAPSAWINIPKAKRARYLSFEPDMGGWNNIRMQFEIVFVLAAATGRILVMPPEAPQYLLSKDQDRTHRSLQEFFAPFDDVVKTITTEEFFKREMIEKKTYPLPKDEETRTVVTNAVKSCDWRAKSDNSCFRLHKYLTEVADFVPDWHGEKHCLIMDDENWHRNRPGDTFNAHRQHIEKFCSAKRKPVYYNREMHDAPLIHFHTYHKDTRLLAHYYAFIYFTAPPIGNFYRRLVRDRVRYNDEIMCAAGKIVYSLINESIGRYFNGAGAEAGYFSMHVRRGDFQWPKMRLSAEEWHENTRHWLQPDDQHLLYIATDETNQTWFAPLMKHYKVRFLSDYAELAGLSNLDPNYVGMIDQIVASRARDFVGTYFSSFSAYIGRIRGYHSISGKRMFYSHPNYWNQTHSWAYPHSSYSAREYPLGWVGIDEDEEPSEKIFY
ncbi:hypothetical protein ACHAXT_000811 [Thalassiosira profunda]